MNKLILMLAMGTALAVGVVSVNAWASEGSNEGTESVSKVTSSDPASTQLAKSVGSEDGANETEGSNDLSENESDDGPVTLPALTPIGTDVLQPLLLKKKQSGETPSLY